MPKTMSLRFSSKRRGTIKISKGYFFNRTNKHANNQHAELTSRAINKRIFVGFFTFQTLLNMKILSVAHFRLHCKI